MRRQTTLMARALKVKGLMNVQFAIQGEGADAIVYVLDEVRRVGIKDVAVETIVTASGS